MKVLIEVSARHVHLDSATFIALFGEGGKLHLRNELSQPGTFAAEETLAIRTANGEFDPVRILGPLRDYNQVELSKTDALRLKIDPPIRDSHELALAGTPGITLIGPQGEVELESGVIIPWRHIHVSPKEARLAKVADGDLVMVDINSDPRSVIFENVLIRVHADYRLAMHIDTDEANAAGIQTGEFGEILKQKVPSPKKSDA